MSSAAQQHVSYLTLYEKMIRDWGPKMKEFLSRQPMHVQARYIRPDFLKENPDFFPDSSVRGKTVFLGMLLGGVGCTVYSQGNYGHIWRNPYFNVDCEENYSLWQKI